MGVPGFIAAQGDWVVGAGFGWRSTVLLDKPSNGRYDAIQGFEMLGKVGYQATSWFMPQLLVGATTLTRDLTGFSSFLRPDVGLMFRFVPLHKEKGFSFAIDSGGLYASLKGTNNVSSNVKAHKVDAVGGVTFSYCMDRACAFAGGRYTMLWLREDGSKNLLKHMGGVYGGVDYYVTPNIFFSAEAQNFDGDALYVGVGGRF